MNLEFLDRFSKNTEIPNFMKIRPVGAEFFHAGGRMEGQTDITRLIVVFRNFANALKSPEKSLKDEIKYLYMKKNL
jgi:hypothetical protein